MIKEQLILLEQSIKCEHTRVYKLSKSLQGIRAIVNDPGRFNHGRLCVLKHIFIDVPFGIKVEVAFYNLRNPKKLNTHLDMFSLHNLDIFETEEMELYFRLKHNNWLNYKGNKC